MVRVGDVTPRSVRRYLLAVLLAALAVMLANPAPALGQDEPEPGTTAEGTTAEADDARQGAGPSEQGAFPILIGMAVVIAVGATLWLGRSSRGWVEEQDEERVREKRRQADERARTWEAKRAAVARKRRARSDEHQQELDAARAQRNRDYLTDRRRRERARREKRPRSRTSRS